MKNVLLIVILTLSTALFSQRNGPYIDPILEDSGTEHVSTIRIGSKSVAYWPYRFLTDPESDDILRCVE